MIEAPNVDRSSISNNYVVFFAQIPILSPVRLCNAGRTVGAQAAPVAHASSRAVPATEIRCERAARVTGVFLPHVFVRSESDRGATFVP